MAKFVMLGKYSSEAVKGISTERTKKGIEIIEKAGGKVNNMLVLLGENDLLFLVDFPGVNEAIKASIELNKLSGIGFTTYPAVSVEEFDKIIG
ncbi:MAG: GYD domain-containing protein [bacterium]